MTENPNTQPEPNAGQPPGGPVGQPSKPAPTPEQPTAEQPTPAAAEPGRTGATEDGAAEHGTEQPGGEATAQPGAEAAGPFTEGPWIESPEEEAGYGEPVDPNAPDTGVAATFLPGIDAASVLALVLAALGAGVYVLVNPLVQAHDAARTWSDFKNNVPRTKQDPFGMQRDWVSYQSWGHIILGLVAVLLALLVLGLWTAQRNNLRSRSFAQAALVLGLAVVLYGILLKTGAVGSEIPSMKEISNGLNSGSSQ